MQLHKVGNVSNKDLHKWIAKQECIPVGCIPSAAVIVTEGQSAQGVSAWGVSA